MPPKPATGLPPFLTCDTQRAWSYGSVVSCMCSQAKEKALGPLRLCTKRDEFAGGRYVPKQGNAPGLIGGECLPPGVCP